METRIWQNSNLDGLGRMGDAQPSHLTGRGAHMAPFGAQGADLVVWGQKEF